MTILEAVLAAKTQGFTRFNGLPFWTGLTRWLASVGRTGIHYFEWDACEYRMDGRCAPREPLSQRRFGNYKIEECNLMHFRKVGGAKHKWRWMIVGQFSGAIR